MSSVVRGPWTAQPAWFVSLDGGGTARKAFGSKSSVAAEAAARIWREMCQAPGFGDSRGEPADDEFDAEVERRLAIYTPEEWTRVCVEDARLLAEAGETA